MVNTIRIILIIIQICCVTVYTLACLGEEDFNKGIGDLFNAVTNAAILYFLWTYPIPK